MKSSSQALSVGLNAEREINLMAIPSDTVMAELNVESTIILVVHTADINTFVIIYAILVDDFFLYISFSFRRNISKVVPIRTRRSFNHSSTPFGSPYFR